MKAFEMIIFVIFGLDVLAMICLGAGLGYAPKQNPGEKTMSMTDQERIKIAEAITLDSYGEQGEAEARGRKAYEIIVSVVVALIGLAMIGLGAGFGYLVLTLGAFMTIKYALQPPRPYRISPEMYDVIFDGEGTTDEGPSGVVTDLSLGLGIGQRN